MPKVKISERLILKLYWSPNIMIDWSCPPLVLNHHVCIDGPTRSVYDTQTHS